MGEVQNRSRRPSTIASLRRRRKFLAGVGAQYESEVVYHSLLKHLEDKGVIFCDTDTAQNTPRIFKKHFGQSSLQRKQARRVEQRRLERSSFI